MACATCVGRGAAEPFASSPIGCLSGPDEVHAVLDQLGGEVGFLAHFGNWKGARPNMPTSAIVGHAEPATPSAVQRHGVMDADVTPAASRSPPTPATRDRLPSSMRAPTMTSGERWPWSATSCVAISLEPRALRPTPWRPHREGSSRQDRAGDRRRLGDRARRRGRRFAPPRRRRRDRSSPGDRRGNEHEVVRLKAEGFTVTAAPATSP